MGAELTTVVMTYNLWAGQLWPEREPAVRALFTTRAPDVLAVQELRPHTRDLLDEVLPKHARVDDNFAGWSQESNIWWHSGLYHLEEYGAADIGIRSKMRRFFWVRLTPTAVDGARPILVATAHYTWPGDSEEQASGLNPRVGEAERTVAALDRLAPHGPCLFMGDLNDHHHPVRVLRQAGFEDSFSALGRSSPITSPVSPVTRPKGNLPPQDIPKVIDFQFYRGPMRVRTAEVAEFFLDQLAPSDHWPVVATYTLDPQ